MAWSRGVGPVRNGGVKWVNTMSVVDDEAWVGNDGWLKHGSMAMGLWQLGSCRLAWRKRGANGEREWGERHEEKIVK